MKKQRNSWKIGFFILLILSIIITGWIWGSTLLAMETIVDEQWEGCKNYHCDNYFDCETLEGYEQSLTECADIINYGDVDDRGYFND